LGMFTATFLQEATTMFVTQGQIEMK
jgi:hypothetical protein